jgi:Ribonuclease R winged-helix domain
VLVDEAQDKLKGTTLEVYRFLLKSNKPVGAREIQRNLKLSTPSLAVYHLSKLEEIDLIRKTNGEYTITKNLLEDYVKISPFLIPRYLFYSIFAVLALAVELIFLQPAILTQDYVFFVGVTLCCAIAFCFETAKTWRKGGL